jgi:hemerythrin superfamily protein
MADDVATDAIALLKADHRKVEQLFHDFDSARRTDRKVRLVEQICTELKIHTAIEEEIFYPAVKPQIDPHIVDEGVVEHDGAKVLINDLEQADPKDEYYDAKVKVLSEQIKHHVGEEERWLTGMFAQSRRTDIDMEALGARLAARKAELQAEANGKGLPLAKPAAVKLIKA